MPSNSTTASAVELITIEHAAQRVGVHKNTIWNWIKRGQLPAQRIGARIVRVSAADVDALFTSYVGGEFGQWAR